MDTPTVFEQIIAGDIPSHMVYESDTISAFLDANPLAVGHTLVVPHEPYERLTNVPETTRIDLWTTVHELLPAIESAVEADATTVGVNDGNEAGQEVPHVHVHIIPRFEDDNGSPIHAVVNQRPDLDQSELETIAETIRS
ncbi:MAG: Diadenosine tetraphosphate (Ap4A) hydrolase and other HIT family hydrolase [Haloquadratum sp. J07HQX50]|jgi:Diadenosine tetraphosphate (Ap4A) hydrolase and other HIT family hydrolases|nr:MAG: Diadenosine tetraphosphate (Ap4A) hydrolase and other HIT family hydrolase [Haloquadratum sp. J07HQX50]